MAACDRRRHHLFGNEGYHDNLAATLAELGLEAPKMLSPLNFLMNIPSTLSGLSVSSHRGGMLVISWCSGPRSVCWWRCLLGHRTC
jgi:hypothetical protein